MYIRNSAFSYETWLLFFSFLSASASFFRLSTNLSAWYKPKLPWTFSAALDLDRRGRSEGGYREITRLSSCILERSDNLNWKKSFETSESILIVNLAEVVCGNSCDIPIVTYWLVQPKGRIKDWLDKDANYQRHKAVLLCLKRNELL